MPHINLSMFPGRSEVEKQAIAKALVEAVKEHLGAPDDSISVVIEDTPSSEWTARVYNPEIGSKASNLYKRPGYEPF